jgi:dihydrofolate reductase
MVKISAVAAISKNRVLGKNNDLIFKIPEDQKRFRDITSGHTVIMGRRTYESIGRPLPNRLNIVISRDPQFKAEGCVVVGSVKEAVEYAKKTPPSSALYHPIPAKQKNGEPRFRASSPVQGEGNPDQEIFIVGGGQIYKESLGITDKLYLTIVDQEAEGDAFFPDYSEFKKVIHEEQKEWNGLKYTFLDLER